MTELSVSESGSVRLVRIGGRAAYLPVHESAEHDANRLHAVLSATNDHVALLRRFVAKLSAEDEAVLLALLREKPEP